MATIHLIGGEKGGVGKSWIARTMTQYFLDGGVAETTTEKPKIPFMAIECDRSNPTLSNIYPGNTLTAVLSENLKYEDSPDSIFTYAEKLPTIVNLPAQAQRALKHWVDSKGLVQIGHSIGVNLVHWFISDGEDDSLGLFIESLQALPEIPHVFIKNLGRCDEWTYFDQHTKVQEAIQQHKVKVIEFPRLSDGRRIAINAQRLTFGQAREHQGFGILGCHQIELYLAKAYQALASTGYLDTTSTIATIATETIPAAKETTKSEATAKSEPTAKPEPTAAKTTKARSTAKSKTAATAESTVS